MTLIKRFIHHFNQVLWDLRTIWLLQIFLLLVGALAIAGVEKILFADAVYFAFITGLTIGYGDLVPYTAFGRIVSVALGFVGIIFSGLVVASTTLALRKAWDDIHSNE